MDCNWEHPGADPYWGKPIAAALATYDYPLPARNEIMRKVFDAKPDGVASIKHDRAVWGDEPIELHDMHWGSGRCTGPVNREGWDMFREERALIYCGSPTHCVAVPFICGNVARVEFLPVPPPPPRLNSEPPRPPWEGGPPLVPPWPHGSPPHAGTIPTPGTLALLGVALAALAITRRKR